VHGARALVAVSKGREGGLWAWVNALLAAVRRRRGGGREQAGADRLGAAHTNSG